MKKTISIFLMLCLLLPGIALAEVQSQVNTPAEYKGTYNSPSGKSHIYVDAQVVVPEAKTIPIYQVFARVPDEMEFKLLADLAFGLGGYTLERGKVDASNPSGVTYVEGAPAETAKGLCLYSIDIGLFYGDREFRDGYYDFDNQSVFTINAMDGTVIDREYVY